MRAYTVAFAVLAFGFVGNAYGQSFYEDQNRVTRDQQQLDRDLDQGASRQNGDYRGYTPRQMDDWQRLQNDRASQTTDQAIEDDDQ